MTKYIVDGCAWQELCNGISCHKCSMLDGDACRIDEYIQKHPINKEKRRMSMTREEAYAELVERHECAKYVDSDYVDCVSIEALDIAIEALKEILAIDHETMKSDFGEIELRGLEKIGGEEE